MKKLTGSEIRQMFLDYFKENGHMIEPGAPLVPRNDPTLLWINSGVAALKKYFDGSETPRSNRIANAQKSIRTNDIENVGKTARHHTFFEMLGNFSIGDYFKEEAIQFAWEFLTSPKWIGFDKEKMYVSVHTDDNVAFDIWVNKCNVSPSHILRTDDNYWEIGEGPSGPNSEIFYDRGPAYDPEGLNEKLFFEELENDRYIEVWNVVFSQYDAKEGVDRKDYKELPQKNIDTGMGLERLVALVQEGETNFDTDLFLPTIRQTEGLAKHKYEGEYKMAYRVIADHIRTVTFALADGASFSNEGRGYVLRRILRRAVRFGIKLEIDGAFMYKLVSTVAETMKDYYPYVVEKVDLISKLVKAEEDTFHSTLVNGEKLLNEALDNSSNKILDGSIMFKLYDTYGYPKELTAEIAEDKGFTVDYKGFEKMMEDQRERARNAREDEQSMTSQSIDLLKFEDNSEFIGYEHLEISDVKVIGLFKDGVKVTSLTNEGEIVLSKTAFYAESGGQVADTGVIYNDTFEANVVNVKKAPHTQNLHTIKITKGQISEGDIVSGKVDSLRRLNIRANHSSVHLLQSALKQIVGDHVAQAGSFVSDEYSRFDFTHYEKVSDSQIKEIELLVNKMIMSDTCVRTDVMSIDDAKNSGAIALFDEKYTDSVRVVTMGDYSKELCGGTHVSNTQEIGVYKIVSEESIGSGIRRITAKTKMGAYEEFVEKEDTLQSIADSLKLNSINNVTTKVNQLIDENSALNKELSRLNQQIMMLSADEIAASSESINGLNVIIKKMENANSSSLKQFAETLRNKKEDSFVFLANVEEDKVVYVVACSNKAIEKGLKAGEIAKLAASLSDGNGGGRPDLAQSGGKDVTKVDQVFEEIRSKL